MSQMSNEQLMKACIDNVYSLIYKIKGSIEYAIDLNEELQSRIEKGSADLLPCVSELQLALSEALKIIGD